MFTTYQGKVSRSGELRRIAALPRRTEPPQGWDQLSAVLGTGTLRPVQAQALAELYCVRGLLGPIRVGAGKTLISYLAPRMVDAQRPLLLVPAKLRDKTHRDFAALAEEWQVVTPPTVYSYEMLGRAKAADYLEEYSPDLIIADEAHRLKNVHAAVTRRVGRYLDAHPETMFVAMSGTMTQRSLMDFAHLAEWALGAGSPLPLTRYDLEQWAMALDEVSQWGDARMHPGALPELDERKRICPGCRSRDGEHNFGSTCTLVSPIEAARDAFNRRLDETPGVVITHGQGVTASIEISEWSHALHPAQTEALARLHDLWELPDGQPLMLAVDVWRHARELAMGFWYRWDPPPPAEWLEARQEWAAFVRLVLSHSRTLDSPAQVAAEHCARPEWLAWAAVRDIYTPNVVVEWITYDVIKAANRWADDNEGIIWVEHQAVGHAFGIRYYGEMGRNSCGQLIDDAEGSIIASRAANSEGRNLQRYHRNLVLSPPTTGDQWEQMLGRTHREGQQADTVTAEVYFGCDQSRDGFWQAVSDAHYQQGVTQSPQKLLLADIAFSERKTT